MLMGSTNQDSHGNGAGFSPAWECHDQGQEARLLQAGEMGSSSRKAPGSASTA